MGPYSKAKRRYNNQSWTARQRGIDFNFTFEEWYNWWLSNGVDKETAPAEYTHSNRLEMCRFNDQGPYEDGNVYCGTHKQNMKDRDTSKFAHMFEKKIHTPYGVFDSRKKAAEFLGIRPQTISYRIRTKDEYYYL